MPPNLFYFAAVEGSVAEGVIHLEVIVSLDYGFLKAATKVAELTDDARRDLKERLKWHFTRDRPVAPLEATPQTLPELATAVAAGLVAHEVPPVLPPDDR